jgi:DNA primase
LQEEGMTHEDKGKFFAKHPQNTEVDEDLKKEILEQVKNNSITCKKAEDIAQEMGFSLEETGRTIDMLNIKLTKCQLGLFGYGETRKIVQQSKEVLPELKESITSALENERLSCLAAWEIANQFNISRTKVASACEAMQIKIKPCQLGAF